MASRGALDGADPAQRGEGRLAAQTFRIVPDSDQQGDGTVRTDAHRGEQLREMALHVPGQMVFQFTDLPGQLLWWGYLNLLTLC
ncbi:hypothetical protein San01_12880 [Streptomyces angustmyceticus]|uniref:Uncharacterized protein n=1 Tax=Streptomyces angustmyceticus TaxID=285578 RepID=A0A5J4LAE6_9ACTN|nr:hypothetical protein San01_12880 [Streptomyces angustmyceticus]